MAGELITKQDELTVRLHEQELSTVLRPLVQEIHLFDTCVAGTSHLQDPSVLKTLEPGQKLTLKREENLFDQKAILVLDGQGRRVGYLPERDNVIFARLMDAGKLLSGRIRAVSWRGSWCCVEIGIYLVDF